MLNLTQFLESPQPSSMTYIFASSCVDAADSVGAAGQT